MVIFVKFIDLDGGSFRKEVYLPCIPRENEELLVAGDTYIVTSVKYELYTDKVFMVVEKKDTLNVY